MPAKIYSCPLGKIDNEPMEFQYQNKKEEFLIKESLQYSISAGLQTRNESFPIYNYENLNLTSTKKLRKDIKDYLLNYLNDFNNHSEADHIEKINLLSNQISKNYGSILHKERFRIGISQKIINLFLKYTWTIGKLEMPYHCPFDCNIIKVKLLKGIKDSNLQDWTELDSISEYEKYVKLARLKAQQDNITIAEWELNNWNRR